MGVAVCIFGVLVLYIVGWMIADNAKLRRRRGPSRDEFIAAFQNENIPEKISAAVYDRCTRFASRGYAPSPDDTYDGVLRMLHEDVDDEAELLVKELRLVLPAESVLREWPSPVRTIRDMVLWLDWVRQHQTMFP
jgi:hypothetical protein